MIHATKLAILDPKNQCDISRSHNNTHTPHLDARHNQFNPAAKFGVNKF